tara:strand:+ start:26777 stop:26974 length:198 start_codon:yes stop_codon:yes gene_type:complete
VSERLADSALRLCGEVCRALGWLPHEFWQVTPAELSTLFKNHDGDPAQGVTRGELTAMLEQDRHE